MDEAKNEFDLFTFLRQRDTVAGLGRLAFAYAVDGTDAELVGGGRLEGRQQHPTGVGRDVSHFGRPAVDRVRNGSRDGHDALLNDEFRDGTVSVKARDPRDVHHLPLALSSSRYGTRRVRQLDDVKVCRA